ncbi:MAG: hypothetical protein AAB288_11165 [Acidobacteriota bacterium]
MNPDPILELFVNKATGDFAIINFAPHENFGYIGWGSTVVISASELKNRTADILRENLEGFGTRKCEKRSQFADLPREEQVRFERTHKLVLITLKEGGRILEVEPMRWGDRGRTGDPRDALRVSLAASNEEISNTLMQAFSKSN